MSRVGKNPIVVPSSVKVSISDSVVLVTGPLGSLSLDVPASVSVVFESGILKVTASSKQRSVSAAWGCVAAVLRNMVYGVVHGFSKTVEMHGVGYKASLEGQTLKMHLGFSHEVLFTVPSDINVSVRVSSTKIPIIVLEGISKDRVGQVACDIRSFRPPEPYKGKGLRYSGEFILRKNGKKK